MRPKKASLLSRTVAHLIFDTKRLRSIGSDLGGTLRGFKDALREGDEEPSKVASLGSSRD
jgi:sec-independent protein translocase protein TatA